MKEADVNTMCEEMAVALGEKHPTLTGEPANYVKCGYIAGLETALRLLEGVLVHTLLVLSGVDTKALLTEFLTVKP